MQNSLRAQLATGGLLLTSYGFATLGTKADQAADSAFAAAVTLLLASGISLVRAGRPRSG